MTVGVLLRDWRQRRRMSQLDLAVEADVSARHLSFVETGRARPSRELVLHLAEHLDVPLRDRNALLLAAGYAPVYQQTPLDGEELAPVRAAIDQILARHEPFPAVVVDRRWDLVSANATALAVFTDGVAPELLEPPVNTMRVSLHPDGLAPRIVNLHEYSEHLVARIERQAAAAGGDVDLRALAEELRGYPGVSDTPSGGEDDTASRLFVPLVLRAGTRHAPPEGSRGRRLTFFTTIATFGTALDITVAELAIESFFPADAVTAETLRALSD